MKSEQRTAQVAAVVIATCLLAPVIGQPVIQPKCFYTILRPETETQLDDGCAFYSRCSAPEECRMVFSGPGGDVKSCGTPGPVLRLCLYYRLGTWNPYTRRCEGGVIDYSELDGYVTGYPNWTSCLPI